MEGRRVGHRGLYIKIFNTADEFGVDQEQSLLHSSEVELTETARAIFELVERTVPTRVGLDSLSELRLLGQNPLHYRCQILALKLFLRAGSARC
ncbi:hypothetical protein [Paracoccus hibiscisoli]|uniref:hypothetical protein n=1 Tax=Paracoccus hibiscisoli TaxID=2023261 RepID=UPI001FE31EBB|nr:hypothetical protein [Paracoccus hibiscisoli]